ncbi:MAG TPA: helix-turn-helix transcriptional regulator [Streptosporangiaceae bacterium]
MTSRKPAPPLPFMELLADELRRHREAAGLTQEQLARRIVFSESLVGMVETCRRIPKVEFIQACDTALRTGGALFRIWTRMVEGTYPAWFRPFADLEAAASALFEFEPQAVPGLLQTEDYARAILRAGRPRDSDEEIERHVAARMARQAILTGENPPLLWVVLNEAVLRRRVGGREVMRAQLVRLVEASMSPHVVIQVLPFDMGEHAEMGGARVIARLPDEGDIVYVEGPGSGQLIGIREEVAECALRFDLLRATALSPDESVAMIRGMISEMIGEG